MILASSATVDSSSSLTTMMQPKSVAASRSSTAVARRWDTLSSLSPRARSRRSCSETDGASRNRQDGVGRHRPDLRGALHVDLEQHVMARRRVRYRRTLQIVEKLDPFEETIVLDMRLERCSIDEVVRIGSFARAGVACRPRATQPQVVHHLEQAIHHGSLADSSGSGQHKSACSARIGIYHRRSLNRRGHRATLMASMAPKRRPPVGRARQPPHRVAPRHRPGRLMPSCAEREPCQHPG